jgi:hypothetical protein
MTELKTKVKHGLNETRMLILGTQVLLGFQFRSALLPTFDHLPASVQYLRLGGLALLLITMGLLVAPAAFHRIVEDGHDTPRLHWTVSVLAALALLPFAMALGIDFSIAGHIVLGPAASWALGGGVVVVALTAWFGLALGRRSPRQKDEEDPGAKATSLKDRVEHVLTEARIVLPGVQALLGFQFAGMLTEGFEHLPENSRIAHLVALGAIGLAGILLMMPAAYHRLVEHGEDTERFHRFASRLVAASMLPLALGLSLDLFVVTWKITASFGVGVAAGAVAFVLFMTAWFGVMVYIKSRDRSRQRRSSSDAVTLRRAG